MAKTGAHELRIYCVCGQKMKVSRNMFGKPGKCIACRQKIRVPEPSELPPGTHVIYLKDYPEFLRKPSHRSNAPDDSQDEQEEAALGESGDLETLVPFTVLPSLQRLCSYEEKVSRRLAALKGAQGNAPASEEKAMLLGYRSLARKARHELEDQLRRKVLETAEDLASLKEQAARVGLSLRVGDMPYSEYLRAVDPLRRARERLEWLLHHLRAWLQVTESHLAGGYIDLPLEEAPVDVAITVTPPTLSGEVLVEGLIEQLRQSLRKREQSERALREWRRIAQESGTPREGQGSHEYEGARLMAGAAVAFARSRLEQSVADAESDIRAIKAHLEVARSRLEAEEISLSRYQDLETELLRGQADNAKARELARRALHANTFTDVPHVAETLLQRLAGPRTMAGGIGADSWLGWCAALLMLGGIAVPLAHTQGQPGAALTFSPLAPGYFGFGALLALTGALPFRAVRGWIYNGLLVVGAASAAYFVQSTWYGNSPVGMAMRTAPDWYLHPGMLLLMVVTAFVAAAAVVSFAPHVRLRAVPAVAGMVAVLSGVLILTDGFGAWGPRPVLGPPVVQGTGGDGYYDVSFDLHNAGGRPVQVGSTALATAPAPYLLLVERQIGTTSWEDVSVPRSIGRGEEVREIPGSARDFPPIRLSAGGRAVLSYRMPPGEYRAQLQSLRGDRLAVFAHRFTLEPLADYDEAATTAREEDEREGEGGEDYLVQAPAAEAPVYLNEADVKLEGVINAAGTEPRFVFGVHRAGREGEQRFLRLGEVIVAPWHVQELNPDTKRVTISNGERLLVMRSGEWLKLETTPDDEGEMP